MDPRRFTLAADHLNAAADDRCDRHYYAQSMAITPPAATLRPVADSRPVVAEPAMLGPGAGLIQARNGPDIRALPRG
jgi:capsular polysaccharide biosynthesis protein